MLPRMLAPLRKPDARCGGGLPVGAPIPRPAVIQQHDAHRTTRLAALWSQFRRRRPPLVIIGDKAVEQGIELRMREQPVDLVLSEVGAVKHEASPSAGGRMLRKPLTKPPAIRPGPY